MMIIIELILFDTLCHLNTQQIYFVRDLQFFFKT